MMMGVKKKCFRDLSECVRHREGMSYDRETSAVLVLEEP